MRILITGAEGQIGTVLSRHLQTQNIQCLCYGFQDLDITNETKILEVFKTKEFDVVINCAAITNVDDAEAQPDLAYNINAKAVYHLGRLCDEYNKYLLHLSTNYVFDGLKDLAYQEEDLKNPLSVYGKTKAQAEDLLLQHCENFIVLRLSWIFSEIPGHNFLVKFLKRTNSHAIVDVVDDQYGCPTSAHHLANFLLFLAKRVVRGDKLEKKIVHFCDRGAGTWFQFACSILEKAKELGIADMNVLCRPSKTEGVLRPKNGILAAPLITTHFHYPLLSWQESLASVLNNLDRSSVSVL